MLREGSISYHVERLENLALVTRAITIHRKCRGLLLQVLLRESNTSTDRDLRAHDTVASEEGRGEDVHRTTLSVGHSNLPPEQLANDTLDSAAAQHSKGMAAVRSNNTVFGGNAMFKSY